MLTSLQASSMESHFRPRPSISLPCHLTSGLVLRSRYHAVSPSALQQTLLSYLPHRSHEYEVFKRNAEAAITRRKIPLR